MLIAHIKASHSYCSLPIIVTRFWNKRQPKFVWKVRKRSHNRFYLKVIFFKSNPKSPSIWASLVNFFCQEPSKIAQFGNLSAMLSLYHPHHKRANFERWLPFEWTSRYRYKKCNLQVFVFQSIKIGTFKKWTNPGLFCIYFCLYQTSIQFLQQIYVKNDHPVYSDGIWTHNLLDTSHLP